jgi:calpain family cysteine protease
MAYRGFEVEAIRTLASDLRSLGDNAYTLHSDISSVLNDAHNAMASGQPATYDHNLENVRTRAATDLLFDSNPVLSIFGGSGTLPGGLSSRLPEMSDEMVRRCDQLEGVRELQEAGYTVTDCALFLDEDPPSQADIDAAVEFFKNLDENDGLNDFDNREELLQAMEDLEGLSAAELDIVMSQVPADELSEYNELLNGTQLFGLSGISREERNAHLSELFSEVGQDNMDKFMDAFPSVQPDFTNGKYLEGDEQWGMPPAGQPMFNGDPSAVDVNQGSFGDCWYLASLAAMAQTDPDYVRDGIRENGNGTVSVRLWDAEGNEQWVTVDRQLPTDENGNLISASDGGEALWPAYYEKAFAQVYGEDPQGTYNSIEGDWSGNASPHLTGQDADDIGGNEFLWMGSSDYENVKEAYENGQAVTLSSTDFDAPDDWEAKGYTDGHAYYVAGFTEDGNVLIGNPWGQGDYPPFEVTPDEFNDAFDDPAATNVP